MMDATLTTTESFGSQEVKVATSTADAAVAAQMQAQVQARYIMAMRRPRDIDLVRSKILRACKRSGFAASAWYQKPVGRGDVITGLSIRFAEEALRCLGNMMPETIILFDDSRKRIVRVQLTDLEANNCQSTDITIEKTVERRQLRRNQKAITHRSNTHGDMVYIVEATEGDLSNKENAQISKTLRNLVLRMLPGDIQDDAKEQLRDTLESDVHRDPDAARKSLVDAFDGINVTADHIAGYLGHAVQTVSPKELIELRQVYAAIRGNETTWHEVMEARKPAEEDAPKEGSKKESIMAKIDKKSAPVAKKDDDEEFNESLKRAAERGKA